MNSSFAPLLSKFLWNRFSASGGVGGWAAFLPSSSVLMKNVSAGPRQTGQLLRVWAESHPAL